MQTVNWGDGQNRQYRWSVFKEVTDGHERTVTKKCDGNHNNRLVEDGVREMTVRAQWMLVKRTFGKGTTDRDTVMTVGSDRLQKHLRRRHVSLVDLSVSWIEVPLRLPCTPPIKTSISPSFFYFA